MDKFDRELQHELLLALYEASPNHLQENVYQELEEKFGQLNFIANIFYLDGHGLLKCKIEDPETFVNGINFITLYDQIRITSKGIDFIRNDGGLGAILNVINVRLNHETINQLEVIITASNAPAEEKATLISTLRKLPSDAIKHLNLKLLDVGLTRLPDVFHAIQNAMHGL